MERPFSTKGRDLHFQVLKKPTGKLKPADLVKTAGWESRETRKVKMKQSTANEDKRPNDGTGIIHEHRRPYSPHFNNSLVHNHLIHSAKMWKRKSQSDE